MKSPLNVSRGTVITSINSFFSASRTQQVAMIFCGVTDSDHATASFFQDVKPVLFKIKINIYHKMLLKRKPFAYVSYILNNSKLDKQDELEVIFMVGSFFQIDEITENNET
ncbi:unnamed protein product [Rotaria sp. Silwood1]|nr:unnamed protein product [Rotaria sp. Silwood1]CAF5063886.1 unnamed protein product [Rotaria sp. Silwood1]CAF5164472.1 unnamed protein product [Rotaria sp. Silwood1]